MRNSFAVLQNIVCLDWGIPIINNPFLRQKFKLPTIKNYHLESGREGATFESKPLYLLFK